MSLDSLKYHLDMGKRNHVDAAKLEKAHAHYDNANSMQKQAALARALEGGMDNLASIEVALQAAKEAYNSTQVEAVAKSFLPAVTAAELALNRLRRDAAYASLSPWQDEGKLSELPKCNA